MTTQGIEKGSEERNVGPNGTDVGLRRTSVRRATFLGAGSDPGQIPIVKRVFIFPLNSDMGDLHESIYVELLGRSKGTRHRSQCPGLRILGFSRTV